MIALRPTHHSCEQLDLAACRSSVRQLRQARLGRHRVSLTRWKNWEAPFWQATLGAAVRDLHTSLLTIVFHHPVAGPLRREFDIQLYEVNEAHPTKTFCALKLLAAADKGVDLVDLDDALEYLQDLLHAAAEFAKISLRFVLAEGAITAGRRAYRMPDFFQVIRAPTATVCLRGMTLTFPIVAITKGRAVLTCYWNLRKLTAEPIVATKVSSYSLASRLLDLTTKAIEVMTTPDFNARHSYGVLLLMAALDSQEALPKFMHQASAFLL